MKNIEIEGVLVVGKKGKLIAFMPEKDTHGVLVARDFTNEEAKTTKSKVYTVRLTSLLEQK